MGRTLLLAGVLGLLAGCGGDPRTRQLTPGEQVIVSAEPGDVQAHVGESGLVESDERPETSGDPMMPLRSVRVVLTSGDEKGQTVDVPRCNLRPVSR